MRLTREILQRAGTLKNGIALNCYQLRLIGVGWPPDHGWVSRVVGMEVSDNVLGAMAELRGVADKHRRRQILGKHGISPSELFQASLFHGDMGEPVDVEYQI